MVARLAQAVSEVSVLDVARIGLHVDLEKLEVETKRLDDAFEQLETMPRDEARSGFGDKILSRLLTHAYHLSIQDDLEIIINSLPNSGRFGPRTGSTLRTAIGKLGRYYSACRFLSAAARKLAIFKNIQVHGVSRPAQIPAYPSTVACENSISAILRRILQIKTSKELVQRIRNFEASSGVSLASAEAQLLKQLVSERRTYRVHAEIQIMFHYELHPEALRPRVICASKSACFLCNLFNEVFGKFYIARTHGVLYYKWTLPRLENASIPRRRIEEVANVVERLNAILEEKIREALQKGKIQCFHPNESVFIEPALWTPSAQSLTTNMCSKALESASLSAMPINHQSDLVKNTNASEMGLAYDNSSGTTGSRSLARQIPSPPSSKASMLSSAPPSSSDAGSLLSEVSDDSICQLSMQSSGHIMTPYESLIQGERIRRELVMTGSPLRLSTRHIHVDLSSEHLRDRQEKTNLVSHYLSEGLTECTKRCWVAVRWLSREQLQRGIEETNIVDLKDLEANMEKTLSHGAAISSTELYVAHKGDIVSIKFSIE